MSKTAELMKQITEVLADYDRQVLEGLIASIPVRREAKKAVQARWDAGEFKGMYATNHYASAVLEAVGGKGWSSLLEWGNAAIAEKLTKQEAAKAEARNAKIAAKLDKAGINAVTGFKASTSRNGYEGTWKIETDKGEKWVRLSVILAGGYNIQCLHHRVLVNVE